MIVVARAEPAVIHHEALHANPGGFFCERTLARFIHMEFGGFPGVVKNRPRLGGETAGKNELAREAVQNAGRFAKAAVGKSAVEWRRRQALAGLQRICKIESVVSAREANLLMRRLLHAESPGTAPAERAKPDPSMLLAGAHPIRFGGVDRKPGIGLMAGGSAPAFQHFHAGMDLLLNQLRFARPAPVQVSKPVTRAGRHVPGSGLSALHRERLRHLILDHGVFFNHAGRGVNAIVEVHQDIVVDVFGQDAQRVAVDFVAHVPQNQVAVAILPGDFQARFGVHVASPAGVLTRRGGGAAVEGSPLILGVGCGEIAVAPQSLTPINVLELVLFVHSKNITGVVRIQHPELLAGEKTNGIFRKSGRAQQHDVQYAREKRMAHFLMIGERSKREGATSRGTRRSPTSARPFW